ncbi:18958_t:CDS:2 [Dentiscutata erythropus]|uniref:18958_t:CDS:1 n=1 Tax=Dentiscutata erythropus TaxID=1348616 RepID=A0A9N9DTE2_9GLOM|nr:18958_t:CDS:2 [Dentiscutata erythropus]
MAGTVIYAVTKSKLCGNKIQIIYVRFCFMAKFIGTFRTLFRKFL